DARAAALRARREAAQRGALLDVDARDAQLVDVGAVVVLGVRDRRLERLADDSGSLLLREREDVQRLVDRLAADQVGDEAALLRRQARAAHGCSRFHVSLYLFPLPATAAFLSAECPLKV